MSELEKYQKVLAARNVSARRAFESELVERATAGDGSAFRTIVDAHRERMFRVSMRVVKNEEDAWDVVQDVMLALHRKLHLFQGNSDLGTWIHRITVNTALMFIRRNARFNRNVGEEVLVSVAQDEDLSQRLEDREELRVIQEAWSQVQPKHQDVLYLRAVEEESLEEIAEKIGMSVAATKSRIHRARLELQSVLAA